MYSIIPRLTPLLPGLIGYIGSAVCILCNLYDQLQCLNSPIHWITLLPFWNFLQILALRRLWMAPVLSVSFTPKKHICLLVAWSKHSDGLKLLKHTFKPMRRDCWRTTCMLLAELPFIIVVWLYSWLNLTIQWIGSKFKFHAVVLHAQEFRDWHTASLFVIKYNNMLQVWQIPRKRVRVVLLDSAAKTENREAGLPAFSWRAHFNGLFMKEGKKKSHTKTKVP